MRLQTRFTDAFGLSTPIAQAGMAFVGATPDLAVAVGNAGGLGSLGVGLMPAAAITATIAAVRAGTDGPFHVNFITGFTGPEQIDAVCAARPAGVSFHWGHPPRAWIDRLHDAGIRVLEQVGSVAGAQRAAGDGVDVIVAQGLEAGGHNFAELPTFALVPLVVDAVAPALVLAAGGVADGRGLAAALMLGADGVWVGTRLVATHESAAHDGYKAGIVEAPATGTVRTALFGPDRPDFNPMRVLGNRVVRDWQDRVAEIPADTSGLPVIGHTELGGVPTELRKFSSLVPVRGLTTGDLDEMALPAGQGAGLVDAVRPAGAIIEAMTRQACELLERHRDRVHTG